MKLNYVLKDFLHHILGQIFNLHFHREHSGLGVCKMLFLFLLFLFLLFLFLLLLFLFWRHFTRRFYLA